MMKLIVAFVLIAAVSAAPSAPLITTPLLAKIAGPQAPASTEHAAHLAAYAPITYAAHPLPLAYSSPTYLASEPAAYYAAAPLAYRTGYHVSYSSQPIEQHGYRIAY